MVRCASATAARRSRARIRRGSGTLRGLPGGREDQMMVRRVGALLAWLVLSSLPTQAQGQPSGSACAALASRHVANATITTTEIVAGGTFTPDSASAIDVPRPICRAAATLRPSSDSDIRIEIWLPLQGWNGKLQAVGNGAFNGAIAYPAMADALARGYAAVSTDTGHDGNTAAFALGHPEKLIDFGWRAVHEMTVAAKD